MIAPALCVMVSMLAMQGAIRGAEAFPPGAHSPGYAAVRVRLVGGAGGQRATLRLSVEDGSSTAVDVEVPANGEGDVVAAVWRSEPKAIVVEFGGARARVDPGPPREIVLAVGELAEAERASDAFGCGMPDVLTVKELPELLDPMALDGFAGIVAAGIPAPAVAAFAARGGAVAEPPLAPGAQIARAAPRLAVDAAGALPPDGLLPRDVFGLSSLPLRVLLAVSIVGAALGLASARRTRAAFAVAAALGLAGGGAVALAASGREAPRAEVSAELGIGLELTAAPPSGALAGAAVFPCGARARLERVLGAAADRWTSSAAVLLARAAGPEAAAVLRLQPVEPPRAFGARFVVAQRDPERGVIVLRRNR